MKAKNISKKIISKNWSEFSEYKVEYERTDGQIEIQTREILDTGNGTAILLYDLQKREIVLIEQYRLATQLNGNENGILMEVPAGLVEKGDHLGTIIKEVKEETGLLITRPTYLFKGFATPGAKTEIIFFYAAPIDEHTPKSEGGGLKEEQEDIIVKYINFDQAIDMVFDGQIIDLKTITLLLYAKKYLFK